MAYGRIVNIEYQSEEDYEIAIKKWIEQFPGNTPDALSRNTTRTGDTTVFFLATYETEALENEGAAAAKRFFDMEGHHIREVIAFHGPVVA